MTANVLLLGAGYSAQAFAAGHQEFGAFSGTTRSPEKFASLRAAGIAPLEFDGAATPEIRTAIGQASHIVVSIAPDEAGDPALKAVAAALGEGLPAPRWIGYLSTVGVYGDRGGAWVDEESACRPASQRARRRLEAEQGWQALGRRAGVPVAVLRLSGIYGPGRNAFVNLRAGTARRLVKPGQVFNRIHRDDIAGALGHLGGHGLGGVFNVTDDCPAPPQDVVAHAAALMGIEPPPEIPLEDARLPPSALAFYGENKRVSNAALKRTGYALRHPDYRAALEAMWAAGDWAAGAPRSAMKRS